MLVVGLGAWCDFVTEDEYRARLSDIGMLSASAVEEALGHFRRGTSFVVHEFADLADGRRLTLHTERGFSGVLRVVGQGDAADQWSDLTLESIERDVRTTVLPDEEPTEDEHPWEWLAGLLRKQGVEASVGDLKRVPYVVEFSERLRARVLGRGA